jgi:hypothetical protein
LRHSGRPVQDSDGRYIFINVSFITFLLNALFFGANGHAPDKIHRQDFQTMLMKAAFDPSLFLHTISAFFRMA